MKTNEYGKYLSEAYDALNCDVDYSLWADFYETCAEKYMKDKPKSICEIACGSGSMSIELAKRAYHVTAFDLSDTMLTLADKKARDNDVSIRFTKQDMRFFKVYSPVSMCVCMMDGINCLTGSGDLSATFESAYDALEKGGLFVFDVNSKRKFENVYAENAYILEEENVLLAWQNFYNKNSKNCNMYLSFFFEDSDGKYERCDEKIRQRMYPQKTIEKELIKAGFEIKLVTGGFDFTQANEKTADRLFFICMKK